MNIKIKENQEINIVELLQESPYCKCGMWLEFKINYILGVLQADCEQCKRRYTTEPLNFNVKIKCCEE